MNPVDDIIGGDGSAYQTTDWIAQAPEHQKLEADEKNAVLAASYPIMQDVIAWFETEIAKATSLDNVSFDMLTINGVTVDRKLSVEAQVLAAYLLKGKLEDKFSQFKDLKQV